MKEREKGRGQKGQDYPDTLIEAIKPERPARPTSAELGRPGAQQVEQARADFETRRRQQIAKAALELDHVDAEILRLMLMHPGITQKQIGDMIGLTRKQIRVRLKAAKLKRALEIANRSALEIFQGNQAAAARRLGELIHSRDEHVAIRATIAHLWGFIHQEKGNMGADQFVAFIQEAFELAQASSSSPAAVPMDRSRDGDGAGA
jgi:hypothetical protein